MAALNFRQLIGTECEKEQMMKCYESHKSYEEYKTESFYYWCLNSRYDKR